MDAAVVTPPSSPRQRPLMTNSPLTDQDRRQVRYLEREMLRNMKEHAEELTQLESDKFELATAELDEMYEYVCYPREGNLDGLCLEELDVAVGKQANTLSGTDMTKFNVSDLIAATRKECSHSNAFDWVRLGEATGACFRSVPETNLLFGLMDTEVVKRIKKKPQRRVIKDDAAEEAQPSLYTSKAEDINGAQARRLHRLKTAVEREANPKVLLFDVTLDSNSFEQTLENLFDTSFLVHTGSLGIGVDENSNLPFLERKSDREAPPSSEQCIISITPAQWEELSQAYGREEPFVGHRS